MLTNSCLLAHHCGERLCVKKNMMESASFYHLCSDGAQARNFIVCKNDYYCAFNLVGVCAAHSDIRIVSFSIEDSHVHFLLHGTRSKCAQFSDMYGTSYLRHVAGTRGTTDGMKLDWTLYGIDNPEYLKNVGTYTIVQPTKDGKQVMFYDYLWGSGSLYFRPSQHIPVWCVKEDGTVAQPVPVGSFGARERRELLFSRRPVPDEWLFCNGFLLPNNYIDPKWFEAIYQTYNCYRVFLASSRSRDEAILSRIAIIRGISMEDIEARRVCKERAKSMFGSGNIRALDVKQRLSLGWELRRSYQLSLRQIATLVNLPEVEIRRYVR